MAKKQNVAATLEGLTPEEMREALKEGAKELTGRVWNPEEEGDFMVGQLIGFDHNVGEFGSTMLRFTDPKGDEVATWQRGTLKTRVTETLIGKYLLIEYAGKQEATKKGHDAMSLFKVFSIPQTSFDAYAGMDELPF